MASYEAPGIPPKITFYTYPDCPWCQRVQFILTELKIPVERIIINLDEPRPQWYLDINPRGLVPAIKFSNDVVVNEIIYESNIISQFLVDLRPSHLLPASLADPSAPLRRARIQFFIDTFMSKLGGQARGLLISDNQDAKVDEVLADVDKFVEPLLADAGPFVDGSKELTYAETQVAPFLLRLYSLSNGTYLPTKLKSGLKDLPNFSKWAAATIEHPSIKSNYNEASVVERTSKTVAKLKAKA
ncbi:glutathione s-transferase [Diplodia corticola]|uniref:Glutathione s-transferase n=1 Tax=Diplodia corticola TaxID=236234 RepID=A0A1J9RFA2_9PEZI|nr:glutathione s-transferase [Diplodia corticola]OJD40198.1 glutathione s-transferase [Diplodia corticola]